MSSNGQHVDLVALDRDGQAVILGEVKARPVAEQEAEERLTSYLKALADPTPFALFVDPARTRLFRWDGRALAPLCTLSTPDVLRPYDPEFGQRRVFEEYLATLVEAWLRDLAYHWKSQHAPAADELAAVGLLPHLEGGSTRTEVEMSGGHLR